MVPFEIGSLSTIPSYRLNWIPTRRLPSFFAASRLGEAQIRSVGGHSTIRVNGGQHGQVSHGPKFTSSTVSGTTIFNLNGVGNGLRRMLVMNLRQNQQDVEIKPEKLALARQAFREFHTQCFWFMRLDAEIEADDVPYICERLRADGGRRGYFLAAEICH